MKETNANNAKEQLRGRIQGEKTHLLAAVESLTFLPSREARCCSRASNRLLGAWGQRNITSHTHNTEPERHGGPSKTT